MLRTHLRIWVHFWRLSVARETHYRANFLTLAVVAILETFMTILPMLLIFSFTSAVSGWSRAESIALVGFFRTAIGVHELLASGGAYRLSSDIQNGDLDLVLIRPVNAQVYVACRFVTLPQMVNVLIGMLVAAIGVARSDVTVGLTSFVQTMAIFICGMILLNAAILGGSYIAFRVTTIDGLNWMLQDVADMGRYPISFYPGAIRFVLTAIVPVAFVTTVPMDALRGFTGWDTVLLTVAFTCLVVMLLRWWWNNSVRHYASAGS